jgi:hypothetical protein
MLPQLQHNGHLATEDEMAKQHPASEPKPPANEAKISKIAALKEALRELGDDAKNSDLEKWIREKYGKEAVSANMSVAKSNRQESDGRTVPDGSPPPSAEDQPCAPEEQFSGSCDGSSPAARRPRREGRGEEAD